MSRSGIEVNYMILNHKNIIAFINPTIVQNILTDEYLQAYSINATIGLSIKEKEEIGILQKIVNLQEFKGLSKCDMKKLVNYYNTIKQLGEVRIYAIVLKNS